MSTTKEPDRRKITGRPRVPVEPRYPKGTRFAVGALVIIRSGHKRGQLVQVWDVKGPMLLVRNWSSNERSRNFWISDHKVHWGDWQEVLERVGQKLLIEPIVLDSLED